VLIGFFSPQAPQSNSIAQPLLALAQQQAPKVKVVIANIDEAKGLKQRYTIQSVPTCVLIKNGQEYTRFQGDVSVPAVNQALEQSAIKNLPH
jgi:thioredoxin 2